MPLTVAKINAATVPSGKKQIKLADGGGMYLLVKPSGKYWKLDYRFGDRRKTLAIGVYPQVTLKEARTKGGAARKLLEQNIDPSQKKQADKKKAIAKTQAVTFEGVAQEWLNKNKPKWAEKTISHKQAQLDIHILPHIGSLPITDIEAPDVLALIRRVEKQGKIETSHRLKMLCGQIFRYAVATSRIKSVPTRDLQGALAPVITTHRPAITEPKAVGQLMRTIQGYDGTFIVHCALQMTPYVFVRPGELRKAEWSEFDFEKAEWRIPAEKMKMKIPHIVPLSKQVLAILHDLQLLTGGGRYLFPALGRVDRPMSENTINAALRALGYDTKTTHCAHGFRGTASTTLHEQGWPSDVIERQLAHREGNAIKAAYDHSRHLPKRIEMMQSYATYLDALRDGAKIIPINSMKAA